MRHLATAYAIWLLSFTVLYLLSFRTLANNQALLNYWTSGFMPFPSLSLSNFYWYVNAFLSLIVLSVDNPYKEGLVQLILFCVFALVFVLGCSSAFIENKEKFFILVGPILFTLFASAMHKYPFKGRLLLFIVPFVLIFVVKGIEIILVKTRNHTAIIGITCIVLLLSYPVLSTSYRLIKPRAIEEIRPVISYIKGHWQQGDLLYLYHSAFYPFKYYQNFYTFSESDYIVREPSAADEHFPTMKSSDFLYDVGMLQGKKRVWLLFSHTRRTKEIKEIDDEKVFLSLLDGFGTRLDAYKVKGAAGYLYDLTRPVQTYGNGTSNP
jgi:hypothetical protein